MGLNDPNMDAITRDQMMTMMLNARFCQVALEFHTTESAPFSTREQTWEKIRRPGAEIGTYQAMFQCTSDAISTFTGLEPREITPEEARREELERLRFYCWTHEETAKTQAEQLTNPEAREYLVGKERAYSDVVRILNAYLGDDLGDEA